MIIDQNLYVSGRSGTPQALAGLAAGGLTVSTDSVDLGVARSIGEGNPLYAQIFVTQTFTGLTTGLIQFQAYHSANANLSGGNGICATDFISQSLLVAGFSIVVPFIPQIAPPGAGVPDVTLRRYIGVGYFCNASAGAVANGAVTAVIVPNYQGGKRFHASGYTA